MPTVRLGKDAKLYRGAAGAQATTEMGNVKDVTVTLETATADVTTRGTSGWRAKKPTLKEMSVEFKMVDKSENADITAIKTAYLAGSPIALWAKDAADGEGPDADFYITSFGREEGLEDAVIYSVKAEACDDSGRAPTWS